MKFGSGLFVDNVKTFTRKYPIFIVLLVAAVIYVFWVWLPFGLLHSWNETYYLSRTTHIVTGGSYLDGIFDNPPLFVYTLSLLSKITGVNVVAFRLFIVFCTLTTTYLIYRIGSILKNKKIGLVSSALYAFFPINMIFSKIIQIDMFAIMLMTSSFYFTILVTKDRKWFLLSGFFLGLAILTKLPSALVFIPIFYYMLHKKVEIRYFILIIIEPILVFLPWLTYVLMVKPSFLTASDSSSKNFFGTGNMHSGEIPYQIAMILLAILALIFLIILFLKVKPKTGTEKTLALFSIMCSLLFVILPNHEYYLLPLFVPLFLFIGITYAEKIKKIKKVATLFLFLSLICLVVRPLYEINWEEASDYIKENYHENITVYSSNPSVMKYLLNENIKWITREGISTNKTILVFSCYDKINLDYSNINKFIEENFVLFKDFNKKLYIYGSKDLMKEVK